MTVQIRLRDMIDYINARSIVIITNDVIIARLTKISISSVYSLETYDDDITVNSLLNMCIDYMCVKENYLNMYVHD